MDLEQRIKTWTMEVAHQRIVAGLKQCRTHNLTVPADPPMFKDIEDVIEFKRVCLNLPLKEIGTLCYLNDLCDIQLDRIRFKY